MHLDDHYTGLYKESIEKIRSDNYQIDNLIDSSSDHRLGVTLILNPDKQVKTNIQTFLSELKAIEPDQYYYPESDIHVTVLSIISCYNGFDLAGISIPDYVELIKKSILNQKSFEIEFRGVTASPSCVMIQGFLSDRTLTDIRDNLRNNFRNSTLMQSIDKRYSIQTAHSTVVRFRKLLTEKEAYINVLEKYRNHHFGTFRVKSFLFVSNDWYHRKEFKKELYRFNIL